MAYHPRQFPDVGIMQYVVLRTIEKNPSKACWRWISDRISKYKDINDGYVSVILFRLEGRGLIEPNEAVKREGERGRPPKTYRLTEEGRLAIRLADALLEAVRV